MKINKDLVDAVMMISFITLVLVGTTDFDSMVTKDVVMALLGLLTVGMAVLRGIQMKQAAKEPKDTDEL
jgi:amino acid transporter